MNSGAPSSPPPPFPSGLAEAEPLTEDENRGLRSHLTKGTYLAGGVAGGLALVLVGIASLNWGSPKFGEILIIAVLLLGTSGFFFGYGLWRLREFPSHALKVQAAVVSHASVAINHRVQASLAFAVEGRVFQVNNVLWTSTLEKARANGGKFWMIVDRRSPTRIILHQLPRPKYELSGSTRYR